MNAFTQIIEQLIAAVPASSWLESRFFSFRHLPHPQSRLFDACIFKKDASGALGFIWIEFEGEKELLTFPFRLARYSEDGDLISLSPWSLREASADSALHEAWRKAFKQKSHMVTAQGREFRIRSAQGDAPVLALGIHNDGINAYVRLETMETIKIFRTLSHEPSGTLEVATLEHLSKQSSFLQYPQLISVHEYCFNESDYGHVAATTQYIQNSGNLWQEMTSLLQQARFPQIMHERSGQESWNKVLSYAESLGRLLGEFHRSMTFIWDRTLTDPEPNTAVTRERWLYNIEIKLTERINDLALMRPKYSGYGPLLDKIPEFGHALFERVSAIQNPGLRIRTHGNLHLGQVLLNQENLFLIDFATDTSDGDNYRLQKQTCLKDLAAAILSIKYAWYTTERGNYSPIFEDFIDKESQFGQRFVRQKTTPLSLPYSPSLIEIQNLLLKYYVSNVSEHANSAELIPTDKSDFDALLSFCLFMRIIKETNRDFKAGNPRCKINLRLLSEFLRERRNLS